MWHYQSHGSFGWQTNRSRSYLIEWTFYFARDKNAGAFAAAAKSLQFLFFCLFSHDISFRSSQKIGEMREEVAKWNECESTNSGTIKTHFSKSLEDAADARRTKTVECAAALVFAQLKTAHECARAHTHVKASQEPRQIVIAIASAYTTFVRTSLRHCDINRIDRHSRAIKVIALWPQLAENTMNGTTQVSSSSLRMLYAPNKKCRRCATHL